VATILGISATHVTQLVAQKLTKVTFPLKSAVVVLLASKSTKLEFGATLIALALCHIMAAPTDNIATGNNQSVFFIRNIEMSNLQNPQLTSSSKRNFNNLSVRWLTALLVARAAGYSVEASALSLADLTNKDAAGGLKAALSRGTATAIEALGKNDGFLGNPLVKIQLPGYMESAAKLLRNLGQGARIDELVTGMNRAAEQAVPLAKNLLVKTVEAISVTDAKNILSGGDGAVTKFFSEKTRTPLGIQFLPIVNKATERVGLADKYNSLASKLQPLGLVKPEDANIQKYVTGKSLDGLYAMIGEEEKKIRKDPIGTGSTLLSKVFGALK
jgi:Protein of unknown function (DUF4197)